MTHGTAMILAEVMTKQAATHNSARVTVTVEADPAGGERLVFFNRWNGARESISVEASDEQRAFAHFRGFMLGDPRLPAEGMRVSFTRGMFGRWGGTFKGFGTHRKGFGAGRCFAYVVARRRNGSAGTYRPYLTDLWW